MRDEPGKILLRASVLAIALAVLGGCVTTTRSALVTAGDSSDCVVLLHGLNRSWHAMSKMAKELQVAGYATVNVDYPSQTGPIEELAPAAVNIGLEKCREADAVRLHFVTHSMGGLVSRAVIEDASLDPGNVRQLIMVAPPNHGSGLARFAFGLEFWDQIANQRRREQTGTFYAWVEDGLSEAATDLRPGSLFLQELNARGRNPKVSYSIFLGTDAPLSEEELAALRRRITAAGSDNRWVRLFGPPVDEWLADLDEVVDGKGDGVVSLKRGRLEGVDDTVVLHFGHVRVLRTAIQGDVPKVHQGVLERLKRRP